LTWAPLCFPRQAHGIPQENTPEILRQVSAKLVAEGKLPAAQLPVTVGDQKLTLSFFNTQTPGQVSSTQSAIQPDPMIRVRSF
jgi:hypothetical protein